MNDKQTNERRISRCYYNALVGNSYLINLCNITVLATVGDAVRRRCHRRCQLQIQKL